MARAGRPSKQTNAVEETVLNGLMAGMSLRKICAKEGMPDRLTVLRWVGDGGEFATKYARARDVQAHFYAEQIIEIADGDDDAAKVRNRMAARQWYAAKLTPKVYGDKQQVELTGADNGPIQLGAPPEIVITQLVAMCQSNPMITHKLRKLLTQALEALPA